MNLFLPRAALFVLACLLTSSLSAQPMPIGMPASTGGPRPLDPGTVPAPLPPATQTAADHAASEELIGPINMPGDNVDAFLQRMEAWTGKTILRPQNLPEATITLILKDRVSKHEAIQAVETLLNMNGIALMPLGTRFLKATSLNLAKSEAPEFIEGSTLGLTPSGRIASKVFQLSFLRIGEFMPQIAGLLNPASGSPPIVFEKTNSALITDSVSNLQRIETLVTQLDQPMLAGLKPKFYQLNNVKASDLVNKMRTMLGGALQAQLGTATTYNPDDRTNQIILMSDPRQHAFFDELIAKLDVVSASNNRNEVIYLKHATAKDVASILSQLVSGQTAAAKASGQEAVNRPGQPGAGPQPVGGPPVTAATMASLALSGEGTNQFSGNVTILSEERTNSIVVSGTMDDIRLIKTLTDKIDILLAQVRIEIVIAEVTLNDGASSGVESLGLNVINGRLIGITGNTSGGSIGGTSVPATTTTPAAVSGYATFAGGLSAAINLSSTPRKSNTTILSVPTIITTHNKEGKIFVGEQRPIISNFLNNGSGSLGTGTNSGLSSGFSSNVTYRDIGIELKVKPLIGTDGSVQLEITQEVNDIVGEVDVGGNKQPSIGRRSTESFVSAQSGEIIVLGGLQRTSKGKNSSRLGPIPIIGDLLGTRSRTSTRSDLVFFLRPTVLTNTSTDNADALKRVEEFPEKHRDAVKQALGVETKP